MYRYDMVQTFKSLRAKTSRCQRPSPSCIPTLAGIRCVLRSRLPSVRIYRLSADTFEKGLGTFFNKAYTQDGRLRRINGTRRAFALSLQGRGSDWKFPAGDRIYPMGSRYGSDGSGRRGSCSWSYRTSRVSHIRQRRRSDNDANAITSLESVYVFGGNGYDTRRVPRLADPQTSRPRDSQRQTKYATSLLSIFGSVSGRRRPHGNR